MDGVYALAAAAEMVWKLSWCFSVTWGVLYITAGSWAKVRYRNPKSCPEVAVDKRYGPVLVSHALFSIVFVNPFCIFFMMWNLGDFVDGAAQFKSLPGIPSGLAATCSALEPIAVSTFYWMLISAYFLLFSLLTDVVVMRLTARVRCLKWLVYKSDLRRWTLVHVVTSLLLLVLSNAVALVINYREIA